MTREELEAEVERLRENADARERVMRREADLLRAAQREVDELRATYAALRQTSADLCVVCGWRFFVPDVGCQGCLVEQLRTDTKRYVAEERAAVVAWLRASIAPAFSDNWPSRLNHVYDAVRLRAESIERGEHRREEEK